MSLKKCKDCDGSVSSSANACPHCGAPMQHRNVISSLARLFIIVFLIIPVGTGIFMSMFQSETSSSTSRSASSAPSTTTKATPTIDKSPKMQADRLKLIERFQREGIFGDIRARSSGATIMVMPAFYSLDFEDKQSFVSVIYAYHFDGSDKYTPITLRDSRTNKDVGSFSSALGLDLE